MEPEQLIDAGALDAATPVSAHRMADLARDRRDAGLQQVCAA